MRGVLNLLATGLAGPQAAHLMSRDDAFQVTKPAAGDTIAISDDTFGRVNLNISWTVPTAISERPVMLTLSQGDDVNNMTEVEVISCKAPLGCTSAVRKCMGHRLDLRF